MLSAQQRDSHGTVGAHEVHMYLPFACHKNALVVVLQLARFVLCSFGSLSLRPLVISMNEPALPLLTAAVFAGFAAELASCTTLSVTRLALCCSNLEGLSIRVCSTWCRVSSGHAEI